MANPWTLKLAHGADLSEDDIARLDQIAAGTVTVARRRDLISEGENPTHVHLIREGYACRYKVLEDGSRQIMAWLLPGDICDLHIAILGEMDHGIATLTQCDVAFVPVETVYELTMSPQINRALWWNTLSDEAILREWLVNIGGRSATQRVAHLFCELLARLHMVERATENAFHYPATQRDLADSLGMSVVQANRSLQALKDEGLIAQTGRTLRVLDVDALRTFSGFNPNYLHADRRRRLGPGLHLATRRG